MIAAIAMLMSVIIAMICMNDVLLTLVLSLSLKALSAIGTLISSFASTEPPYAAAGVRLWVHEGHPLVTPDQGAVNETLWQRSVADGR